LELVVLAFVHVPGDEEFLEEQLAMMMQLGSPYLGMINRE
jgi:hypothetical protein